MDLQNSINKKIERKKFFISIASLAAGFALKKIIPFKFWNKKSFSEELSKSKMEKKLVKINSFAVNRNKIGNKNAEK